MLNKLDTYRILGVLASHQTIKINVDKSFKQEYGIEKHDKLYKSFLLSKMRRKYLDFGNVRFETLLKENRYNLIDKYIKMDLGLNNGIVINDICAGEGKMLKLFKQLSGTNILIGNESDINKYETMIQDDLIDYKYNSTFEELLLPKKVTNVMLFNPNNENNDGESNVRKHLETIVERELMAKNGIMVMVIKKNDALQCIDLISQYCNPDILCYKTDDEEQIVLYAIMKDKVLDLDILIDAANLKKGKEQLQNIINECKEFDIDNYKFFKQYRYKVLDIDKAFENLKYIENNIKFVSKKRDNAWKWILHETEIKDLCEEVLTIPKQFKSGELCNVIASGKINGELSLADNTGKHIVVGGVKTVTVEKTIEVDDKKSKNTIQKLETTIQSVPYLNLLINDNGKLKIKELKTENV